MPINLVLNIFFVVRISKYPYNKLLMEYLKTKERKEKKKHRTLQCSINTYVFSLVISTTVLTMELSLDYSIRR